MIKCNVNGSCSRVPHVSLDYNSRAVVAGCKKKKGGRNEGREGRAKMLKEESAREVLVVTAEKYAGNASLPRATNAIA